MKTLNIVFASVALLISANSYATMEASWNSNGSDKLLGSNIVTCPPYIYTTDTNGKLVEKVWSHEFKRHNESPVATAECVYR